jgi:recombination protein RecA
MKEEKEEKAKDLKSTISEMNSKYGKNTILAETEYINPDNIISTGSLGIDKALGVGGLVRGKMVEIAGWSSGGKSTFTLHVIAEAQKKGIKCALIDGEFSFDRKYAEALGVDVDELVISQPGFGEAAYDVANSLCKTKEVGVVIIDSQTSLLPKKAMEGEGGEYALGLHARLLSLEIPKLMQNAAKNNVLVILISQYREKIGVMFGNPTTTNGGHAIPFYSHVRLEVFRPSLKAENKEEGYNDIRIKVIKNKLAVPFKEWTIECLWGIGWNKQKEIIDMALEYGIISRAGSTYSYGETKLAVGITKVYELLSDNIELLEAIKQEVLNHE